MMITTLHDVKTTANKRAITEIHTNQLNESQKQTLQLDIAEIKFTSIIITMGTNQSFKSSHTKRKEPLYAMLIKPSKNTQHPLTLLVKPLVTTRSEKHIKK